jgi:hypothetical protein
VHINLNSNIKFWVCCLVFRLLLEHSYVEFIVPLFEYEGFNLESSWISYSESWALYIFGIAVIGKKLLFPSDYLLGLAFFIFLAPLLVFYGYCDQKRYTVYLVAMQFYIALKVSNNFTINYLPRTGGQLLAVRLAIAISAVASLWILFQGGLDNFNLDFSRVYEFRESTTENVYTSFWGYLVTWATSVTGPLLLCIVLKSRRYWFIIPILLLQVFWYGTTSHKSVLFYPFLVVFAFVFYRKNVTLSWIPIGMALLIIMVLINYRLTDNIMAPSMFVRRVFFVPARLTFMYHDFFSREDLVFWSSSILRYVIRYPYQDPIPLIIGAEFGETDLWANVGFFGTSYMHAAIFGVVIYGFIGGILLGIIDSIAKSGVENWVIISITSVPFYNLAAHTDLPTALLTHGLGLAILLSYLLTPLKKIDPS